MTTPSPFFNTSSDQSKPLTPLPTPPSQGMRFPRVQRTLLTGVLVAVIVTMTGGYLAYTRFFLVSVSWGAAFSGFSTRDQQLIGDDIRSVFAGNAPGHRLTIINAQRQGNWAVLSLNERTPFAQAPLGTEPLFYVANQSGTRWTVWRTSSTNFCTVLAALPQSLLVDSDKSYFLDCYPSLTLGVMSERLTKRSIGTGLPQLTTAVQLSATSSDGNSSFHLPVLPGVSVFVSQGNNDLQHDHNDSTGQRYAFDFTVEQQNFTITAAQGGRVIGANDRSDIQCSGLNWEQTPVNQYRKNCWAHANFVLIEDNDGTTASLYMHLLPHSLLAHNGDVVAQGQSIAKAGTTGWSTGVHLHLQVERVPTPQADPYTGWWWQPSLPLIFDDPVVQAQDANGVPLEGQTFTEGGSPVARRTPTPTTTRVGPLCHGPVPPVGFTATAYPIGGICWNYPSSWSSPPKDVAPDGYHYFTMVATNSPAYNSLTYQQSGNNFSGSIVDGVQIATQGLGAQVAIFPSRPLPNQISVTIGAYTWTEQGTSPRFSIKRGTTTLEVILMLTHRAGVNVLAVIVAPQNTANSDFTKFFRPMLESLTFVS